MKRTNSPSTSRGSSRPSSRSDTTIAPALMNGLRGMPASVSNWTIELNALPDGSRPTRFHKASPTRPSAMVSVKTLQMLWIEKGSSASPATWAVPSGSAFNSIVQLETEAGIPRNPFINAGAIVVSDLLLGRLEPREVLGEFVRFMRSLAGDDTIVMDEIVARAEIATGFRNAALANYMKAFGNLDNPVERVLGVYIHQCAVAMSCRQLALAGRFLMARGRNPETGRGVVSAGRARRINALMMTCGHYDGSGEFAFRVGLPGKSGVGGGILAIAPGRASICVWAPGLNERGNSQIGSVALEMLAQRTGWSVFDPMG